MQIPEEDEAYSHKPIPGVTPDYIITQLKIQPLLVTHWQKNTPKLQDRLIEVLRRYPTAADCPGYIYGFRTKEGYDSRECPYEIKMGRTRRQQPQVRIMQWERDDHHQYVQIFTVRSQHNNKLEALVHILFAYARINKMVNGHNRIEWFKFNEIVPTGAAINLLNLLMEKIQLRQLEFPVKPPLLEPYSDLILSLAIKINKYKACKEKFVVFGLPRTGKSSIGHALTGQVIPDQSGNLHSNNNKQSDLFDQMGLVSWHAEPYEVLEELFFRWKRLCSIESIVPVLAINKGDVEASLMTGLFEGIKLVKDHLKCENFPPIVITRGKDMNLVKLQLLYQDNKFFFDDRKAELIEELLKEKSFMITSDKITVNDHGLLKGHCDSWAQKSNANIRFKLPEDLNHLCHQLIEIAYMSLQDMYLTKIKACFSEAKEEAAVSKLIFKVSVLLDDLKQDYSSDQTIYQLLYKLNEFLRTTDIQKAESQFYVFCECSVNKTLSHTLIFEKMAEFISKERVNLVTNINQEQLKVLDQLKKNLQVDQSPFEEFQQIMKEAQDIVTVVKLLRVVRVKCQIKAERKGLEGTVEKLLELLQRIQDYEQFEMAFNNIFNRIKEAIYIGLKGPQQDSFANQSVIVLSSDQEKETNYPDLEGQGKMVQNTSNSKKKQEKEKQASPKKTTKEKKQWKVEGFDLSNFTLWKYDKMSQIINRAKKEGQSGQTIINTCESQFIFDKVSVNLGQHFLIFAKSATVSDIWSMRFKSDFKSQTGKPLRFIIIAETLIDHRKLIPPLSSPNGKVHIISFKADQPFALMGSFDANQPVWKEIIKLYRQHIR